MMTAMIGQQLAELQRLTTPQLRTRFAELFGEHTPANNRTWLFKRIAWRLQALAEGGLSERARQRAAELANDADLRLNPPLPQVLPRGFAYNGQVFKSLSAVAKAITGSHCNGFWFFGLGPQGDH
jgi:Protein of unknown function (DUF2924)